MLTRIILILMLSLYSNKVNLQRSVTPQNCTKRLRNFIFVVQFAYLSVRPNKERGRQFWNLRYKKQLLTIFGQLSGNVLRNWGKLFGKSRGTYGKP